MIALRWRTRKCDVGEKGQKEAVVMVIKSESQGIWREGEDGCRVAGVSREQ